MTQVISLLTEDYAFQVSDRRFTTPTGEVVDDDGNKAITYARQSVWAYTGFSVLPATPFMRSDKWLAEHLLPPGDLEQTFLTVAKNASAAIAQLPPEAGPPEQRLHAFVGAGYAFIDTATGSDTEGLTGLRPIFLCVSNYLLANTERMPLAQPEFTFSVCPMAQGTTLTIHVAGQPLPDGIEETLLDALLETGGDPVECVKRLAVAVRITAQHNDSVGRNLMVSILPRAVAGTPGPLAAIPAAAAAGRPLEEIPIARDAPTFIYLTEEDRAEAFGPWAVSPGSMVAGETRLLISEDSEWPPPYLPEPR